MTPTTPPSDVIYHPDGISPRWWAQITALALIVIELCWVVPWYRTVIQISYVASPLRASLVLGAIMLIAYAVTQTFEVVQLLPVLQRGLMVGLFAFCLVTGSRLLLNSPVIGAVNGLITLDPGAVLALFAILWLWWRGVSLARLPIRPLFAWRRFVLGLWMYMALVLIVARLGVAEAGPPPSLNLFAFFMLVSLLGLVFARITYVSIAHGVKKNPFDRRWLITTSLTVFIVVSVAVILGVLLTGQYTVLLDQTASLVQWLAVAVFFLASLPWLLLTYLFSPLVPLLRQFFTRAQSTPVPTVDPYAAPIMPPPLEVAEQVQISLLFQQIVFWGIVALILVGLLLAARRFRRQGMENWDDSESLLEEGDALRLLRKAIREGWQEAQNRLRQRLNPARRFLAAARVRRIYAHLMDLCARLGHPRPEATTPLEFLPELGELFPAQIAELELITDAYNRVRYGELPETEVELEALDQAWKSLVSAGRNIRRTRQETLQTAELKEVRKIGL